MNDRAVAPNLIWLLLSAAIPLSCGPAGGAGDVSSRIASRDGPVTVALPEAYELSNIILALTEYGRSDPWEVRKDFPYYEDVLSHFGPYTDHPLLAQVNYSRERWREYLSFRTDAVAFAFNDVGRLERATDFATHGNLSPFDDHLDLVNDFVETSDFRAFFADHADYYRSIVDEYADYYMIDPMLRFLREHVGSETAGEENHFIALSPLVYRMNAHRPIDDTTSGDFPTLADRLVGKGGDRPDAKTRAIDIHTLFTEADHGFVNPLSQRFAEAIGNRFDYSLWQDSAGYQSDLGTFNEYVTWALYDLFVEEHFPEHAEEVSVYWHYQNKSRGFIYSGLFARTLKELWGGRGGAALDELYPELTAWTEDVQSGLSEPVVTEPVDSTSVSCGSPADLSLTFSEPMETADRLALIIQDGRTRLDTVLVSRDAGQLEWSGDGQTAVFQLTVPPLDDPYLVFNWWGARYPLRSRKGVLLKSPTAIQLRCRKGPPIDGDARS